MGLVVAEKNITVLLFDLGGVIVDIDFDRVFSYWISLSPSSSFPSIQQFSLLRSYRQHECGQINYDEFYRNVCESLSINITKQQFLEGWNRIFLGLVGGIGDLLESIPGDIPKYVFSNTNVVHEEFWRNEYADVLKNFKQVFTSVELGMRKPEAAAYREVLARIGIESDQVLFFDDSIENITSATACGIESVLVRSISDISEALSRYGIVGFSR